MINSKKFGFTLGELLIAVLITGIIAILTLPSLIKGIQAKSRMALLKNTVANVGNLVQRELSAKRADDIKLTNIYSDPQAFLAEFSVSTKSNKPFASSYKRLSDNKKVSVVIPSNSKSGQGCVLLKNGVGIGIVNTSAGGTNVIIDINGAAGPNIIGADYFVMKIETDEGKGFKVGDVSSVEILDAYTGAETNSELKTACKNGNGAACFRLAVLSGYDYSYLR